MLSTTFTFTSSDGEEVFVYRWAPERPARAMVQIAHGMGEHAARYERLAETLTAQGYVVYANDHRGHGRTAGDPSRHGSFGTGGWRGLVDDMAELTTIGRDEHPGRPLVLLGHSMGSFALQHYMLEHSARIDGAALSGTSAIDVIAQGIDASQPADLTAFNAAFEPARTPYDWLSRDPDEVDKYIADEACGFGVDVAAMSGMLEGAADLGDVGKLSAIRPDLPIYIASGDADPLAAGGALIELVADRYRQAGITDVTVKLYAGARHEIFNETNRDEVTSDLVAWLARVTGA